MDARDRIVSRNASFSKNNDAFGALFDDDDDDDDVAVVELQLILPNSNGRITVFHSSKVLLLLLAALPVSSALPLDDFSKCNKN